jgi:hypothetical protein
MTRIAMFRIAAVIAAPLVMAAPAISIAGPIAGAAMRAAAPGSTIEVRHRPAGTYVREYPSYSYWGYPSYNYWGYPGYSSYYWYYPGSYAYTW